MTSLTRKNGLFYVAFLVMIGMSCGQSTIYSMTTENSIDSKQQEASRDARWLFDNTSERKTTEDIHAKPASSEIPEAIDNKYEHKQTAAVLMSQSFVDKIVSKGPDTYSDQPKEVPTTDAPDNEVVVKGMGTSDSAPVDGVENRTETNKDESTDSLNIDTLPKTIGLPDPIANYANQIYFYSPEVFGVREQVIDMIHDALSYGRYFSPVEALNVLPVSARFQVNEDGDKLTSVTYVVSHNGLFVHSETITTIMNKPEVKKHLHKHLASKGLREYRLKPFKTSWAHDHIVAIVVPSCVCFVIILFIIVFSIRRRSVNSKQEKKKSSKFTTPGSEKCGPPPAYDTVYGINNPAYDFESAGHAMP